MENNSLNIREWLKLIRAEGVGPVTFAQLLKQFGSVDAIEIEDLRLKIENYPWKVKYPY